MSKLTIGLGAQLANGKDVLADYLVNRLNQIDNELWVRNSFANRVKKTFEDTFDVTREFVEHWKRIPEPPPGFDLPIRDCLIRIGDYFRQMKSDIWIELAFRDQEHNQIISDERYLNETIYVRKHRGFSVLLWRPGFENAIDNKSESSFVPYINYCIEKDIDGVINDESIPFDYFFRNDGSLEDLYQKADKKLIPHLQEWIKYENTYTSRYQS